MKRIIKSGLVLALLIQCTCGRQINEDLVKAAGQRDTQAIGSLLSNGANINGYNSDEWTPLTMAAREGQGESVRVLLESGASVNEPEGGGNTPIFWAAWGGNPQIVNLLISKGADVNKKCG